MLLQPMESNSANVCVDDVFKTGGALSKHLSNYSPRPGQVALAKAVESAIRDERHLLAEGPTGTGKSLAYGIPAAIHALKTGQSVVIATANIALQEQLAKKDLPLIAVLMKDLGLGELQFFSRKGLGNYVCLYRLEEKVREGESWARELKTWVIANNQGDREELPIDYHGCWSDVCANRDECHHSKCSFYSGCFAFRSRVGSDLTGCVVVTNYHLLYADRLVKTATAGCRGLLPQYTVTIMDEAHEAIDIARGFQGFDLSMINIWWILRRFRKFVKYGHDDAIEKVRQEGHAFFKKVMAFHQKNKGGVFKKPLGFGAEFITALRDLAEAGEQAATKLHDEEKALLLRLVELTYRRVYEFGGVCYGRSSDSPEYLFAEFEEIDEEGFDDEIKDTGFEAGVLDPDSVYFTELAGKDHVKLCKKVIEVQEFIREEFLKDTTLVATSATLSTNGNFNFIAKELGLESDEYASLIAPSPFDPKRMLVVVPEGFPSPKDRDQHIHCVSTAIEKIVQELKGRSMALFTSYRSLETVTAHLEKKLTNIELLVQGRMPRGKIVERLKKNENSLILATASFWQGVDIPGRALSCLFIEKFPFAPPTDPVLCYMEDKWAKQKGRFSAFSHYSVPKAVISLKQGVGRLIRTESDYGVVVLFDPRLETTKYGAHFESAFPDDHFRAASLSSVAKFIQEHDKEGHDD